MPKPVEFTAKVHRKRNPRDLDEDEKAYREAQRIINPDKYIDGEDDEDEVGYKRLIIDLELIADALELDEGYVQIVMKHGIVYILKLDYEDYKLIYQDVLSILVKVVDEDTVKK